MSHDRVNVVDALGMLSDFYPEWVGVNDAKLARISAIVAELVAAADDMTAPYLEPIERMRAMPRVAAAVKAAKGEA